MKKGRRKPLASLPAIMTVIRLLRCASESASYQFAYRYGGNITAAEIAEKIPAGADTVFVRVDQNKGNAEQYQRFPYSSDLSRYFQISTRFSDSNPCISSPRLHFGNLQG
jgi:hypothetical protein